MTTLPSKMTLPHFPQTIAYRDSVILERAMCRRDMSCPELVAASQRHPETYFQQLQAHAYCVSSAQVQEDSNGALCSRNGTLVMWPVIVDSPLVTGRADRAFGMSTEASLHIASLLRDATLGQSIVGLMTDFLDYNQVAGKEPLFYRQLLEQIAGHREHILIPESKPESTFVSRFVSALPGDAPMLYFKVGALVRLHKWPELDTRLPYLQPQCVATEPGTNFGSMSRLAEQFAATLRSEFCAPNSCPSRILYVGEPEFAETAIESGLTSWLTLLYERYQFGAWDVTPHATDSAQLRIALLDASTAEMNLPLRTFQLGVNGLERVLAHVAILAGLGATGIERGSLQ